MRTILSAATACILLAFAISASADTCGWRGDGSGVYPAADPPTSWDYGKKAGILWSVKVGTSFSAPVPSGDRVFLTVEDDKLLCIDVKTHKALWEKANPVEELHKAANPEEEVKKAEAGFATASPVTDGKCVWASYGTGVVVCYDFDGNRKWTVWLEYRPQSEYGRAASPLLVDGKLIVTMGGLVALDPATGKKLWYQDKASEGFGTPVAAKIGDDWVVITGRGDVVKAADGALVEASISSTGYGSPVVKDGVAYFVDSTTEAIKLPEKLGAKNVFKKLWTADIDGEVFSSPVVYEGIVYGVSNFGYLMAFDAQKGDVIWKKKVGIGSAAPEEGAATANIYPSLAVAGGKLFLSNDRGETLVLQPGKEYKELSKNEAEEGSGASAAFDGKFIYQRGGEMLYCIGK